ncbi:MAG: hypothetical protein ACLTUO_00215 [Bifidobacterium sp.]
MHLDKHWLLDFTLNAQNSSADAGIPAAPRLHADRKAPEADNPCIGVPRLALSLLGPAFQCRGRCRRSFVTALRLQFGGVNWYKELFDDVPQGAYSANHPPLAVGHFRPASTSK